MEPEARERPSVASRSAVLVAERARLMRTRKIKRAQKHLRRLKNAASQLSEEDIG